MTYREEEMFEHLARGRALRSQAFVAALRWMVRGVKAAFGARPAPLPTGAHRVAS